MAFDIGDRTVGVAISDELGITAQPYKTLHYKSSQERKKLFQFLSTLIRENSIQTVVYGLPLNMNGSFGPQAEKTQDFIEDLQEFLNKKSDDFSAIVWLPWDERLSTKGAERTLLEADLSRAKRKKIIDTSAAVFILQGFLESPQNRY